MISVFDRVKLRDLLHDFYEITKIRITVFDESRNELIAYPEEHTDFCKIVRGSETGRIACAACDRESCAKAASQRATQIYRCHAGLTEAVTPLIVGNVLVGYLLFGQVFSYPDHESGWAEIQKLCEDLPVDTDLLRAAILDRPIISQDYVRAATRILLAVASYLVMERMAILQSDQLAAQLDNYLTAHFTEDFTASRLCQILGIGRTQLYKISQALYGCGISSHIRDLRLAAAKELLLNQRELSLEEVSACCGFHDYNYFISVFSRNVGCPPGAWRKINLNSTDF